MLTPSVCPSGAALATAAVPVLPLAPALFSTTKVAPSRWLSPSATMRARVSGVDPAMNGTMMLTLREGHSCAGRGLEPAASTKSPSSTLRIGSPSRPRLGLSCAHYAGRSSLNKAAPCR